MRRLFILLLLVIALLQAGCAGDILLLPAVVIGHPDTPEQTDPTKKCTAERMALQRGYQVEECSISPEILQKLDPRPKPPGIKLW